jgi:hypothetical protein
MAIAVRVTNVILEDMLDVSQLSSKLILPVLGDIS